MLPAVSIGKLHVTSGEADRLAVQLRVTHALDAATLHPPGLPTAAILCVRRLRAPAVTRLPRHVGDRLSHATEEATRHMLEDLARTARRPAHEAATAAAEAVLFADQAELLACLAADWCAGVLYAHWWWTPLLASRDPAQVVRDAWQAAPAYAPAALHHLAERQTLVPFLSRLSDVEARELTIRIAAHFGLARLRAVLAAHRAPVEQPGAAPVAASGDRPVGAASQSTTRPALPRQQRSAGATLAVLGA